MPRLTRQCEIYRHACLNAYHPSLICLNEREWVVTHDLGSTPHALDYHTQALETKDGGETWVELGRLMPEAEATTHTIRTRRFSDGRVIGFGKWEDRRSHRERRSSPTTGGQVPMRLFWIASEDNGKSWSESRWIDPPLVGPTWELCHPMIEFPDGRWGAPVAKWRDWEGNLPEGEQSGIVISHDEGRSWPGFVRTFDGRESGRIHWEQSVVFLSNERLLATAWVFDPVMGRTEPSVFTISRDGGQSFDPPKQTGFLAQTCKLVAVGAERVLAVYRRVDEPGLWAELAEVNDAGWRCLARIPVYGGVVDGEGRPVAAQLDALEFGYPSVALSGGGKAVVIFWCRDGRQTVLRLAELEIPEEVGQ